MEQVLEDSPEWGIADEVTGTEQAPVHDLVHRKCVHTWVRGNPGEGGFHDDLRAWQQPGAARISVEVVWCKACGAVLFAPAEMARLVPVDPSVRAHVDGCVVVDCELEHDPFDDADGDDDGELEDDHDPFGDDDQDDDALLGLVRGHGELLDALDQLQVRRGQSPPPPPPPPRPPPPRTPPPHELVDPGDVTAVQAAMGHSQLATTHGVEAIGFEPTTPCLQSTFRERLDALLACPTCFSLLTDVLRIHEGEGHVGTPVGTPAAAGKAGA